MYVCICMYTLCICTCSGTYSHMNTNVHTYIHAYIYENLCASWLPHIQTYKRACILAYRRTERQTDRQTRQTDRQRQAQRHTWVDDMCPSTTCGILRPNHAILVCRADITTFYQGCQRRDPLRTFRRSRLPSALRPTTSQAWEAHVPCLQLKHYG